MRLRQGSLFSGIGGFDLAAEWAGWENMFHCEINPFGQKVLKYYWPNAISYADVKETDFTIWRGRIDVLTGGFPCQGFSLAGLRKGTNDDRYLWPQYLRVIREVKPPFVVGENVTGILSMGEREVFARVDSRNIVRYEDFDNYEAIYTRQEKMLVTSICKDLEKEGYQVQVFAIPAAGIGAPHKRERIWFVAHNSNAGNKNLQLSRENRVCGFRDVTNTYSKFRGEQQQQQSCTGKRTWNKFDWCNKEIITNPHLPGCERPDEQEFFGWSCDTPEPSFDGENGITTNTSGNRREREREESEIKTGLQQRSESTGKLEGRLERFCNDRDATDTISLGLRGEGNGIRKSGFINEDGERDFWRNFPTQPAIRSRNDGFSRPLVRYLTKEVINEISNTSKENRIQNLSEMWERVSQKEVWEEVRRFYSLESKEVLFQTMQLYQTENIRQNELSPFSEDFSKPVLQKLRKYGEFRRSPQGQKLQKQRTEQPGNIVSFLPHEIPLAARAFESAMAKFETWHRNESIKAYGNAIVPQVAFQIFKAINQFNETIK